MAHGTIEFKMAFKGMVIADLFVEVRRVEFDATVVREKHTSFDMPGTVILAPCGQPLFTAHPIGHEAAAIAEQSADRRGDTVNQVLTPILIVACEDFVAAIARQHDGYMLACQFGDKVGR